MTFFRFLLVLVGLTFIPVQAWAEKYGAIAYSPASGKYGYSNNSQTRAVAERVALSNCSSRDVRIAIWVKDGWAVVYRNSRGAWNSAWSSESLENAKAIARSKVPNGQLVCWVYSGK